MSLPARTLTPPLKWHGGKHYLAPRIVGLMPRHLHYVEPFFGGGAVLLLRDPADSSLLEVVTLEPSTNPVLLLRDPADPSLWLPPNKGVSELVNDVNGRLVNFWRVLQDEKTFSKFVRIAQAIPVAREEWEAAHAHIPSGNDPVADAVAFFVDCRQSRSGLMKGFTPVTRSRTRREMNGNVSEWLSAVDGLPEVHARLRRVLIENMPAVKLIRREDAPNTLFYCDPPYLHTTRKATAAYAFEMTESDHEELLDVLRQCKGKVMLSGYPSKLYDDALTGWNRHTFDLPNHAANGKEKRRETEVLWCNF